MVLNILGTWCEDSSWEHRSVVAVFRTQHHCDSVSQRQSHSADITPVAPTITNHEIKVGVLQTILDQKPINYFWHLKQFLLKNNVNFIDLSVFGFHSIAKTDDDTKVKSVCCCVVLTMWNVTCNYQITNHPNLNVIFSNSALLDK